MRLDIALAFFFRGRCGRAAVFIEGGPAARF
jgi:hypothetical protein